MPTLSHPIRFKRSSPSNCPSVLANQPNLDLNPNFDINIDQLHSAYRTMCKEMRKSRKSKAPVVLPEDYVDQVYKTVSRFFRIFGSAYEEFTCSMLLKWLLEETALAINEQVAPGESLFEIVDDRKFKVFPKIADTKFNAVILRRKSLEERFPVYVLMAIATSGAYEHIKKQMCANLKFAYDENKKHGILAKMHGLVIDIHSWYSFTYDGEKVVDNYPGCYPREDAKFELNGLDTHEESESVVGTPWKLELLDRNVWHNRNKGFLCLVYSAFESNIFVRT